MIMLIDVGQYMQAPVSILWFAGQHINAPVSMLGFVSQYIDESDRHFSQENVLLLLGEMEPLIGIPLLLN